MLPVQDKVSRWINSVALEWSVRSASQGRGVHVIHLCQVASAVYVSECQDAGMQEEMKLCDKIEHCNC